MAVLFTPVILIIITSLPVMFYSQVVISVTVCRVPAERHAMLFVIRREISHPTLTV